MSRLAYIRRDLGIVARAVWLNLTLYATSLLGAALLLWIWRSYPQADFFELLITCFYMSLFEAVPLPKHEMLPTALVLVLPVMTIIILGEGALRVAAVFLRRRQRREEWDPLVAQTFSKHTVLCGLGELGRAIYRELMAKDPMAQVVVVDSRPNIVAELGQTGLNVCQVQGDMTTRATLEGANCHTASIIILTSGNDAYNLEAGFKAREISPQAQIWIRLYRKGLSSLIDAATMPNVHFFCPYDRSAETLVGHVTERKGERRG